MEEPYRAKTNWELLELLAAALDHTLVFSSINTRWPEQKDATLRLIREARRRCKEAKDARAEA